MMSADPLSLVGTTISEKYEVERVVGEGGFATVYRARHMVWDRPVAIKVFRALGDLPPDRRAQLVEGFLQEGRLLAELSERSAAICQARDVGTLTMRDGREMPYMVLEWLEGRSLEQTLDVEKASRLVPRDPEQALRLLEPVAEALALAHRKGIAHRDVKPANIFILGDARGDFSVKLLDFGIAKVVQDAQRLGGSFAQTQGEMSSFTPAYGAPEQFSRAQGATGPWTDVFALALIFTELLTNDSALRGDDLTQLAFASMDPRTRPTPRTFGVLVPDGLEAVLRRALAVSPNDRFRSMGEFWNALRGSLLMAPSRSFDVGDPASSSPSLQLTALDTAAAVRSSVVGAASSVVGAASSPSGVQSSTGSEATRQSPYGVTPPAAFGGYPTLPATGRAPAPSVSKSGLGTPALVVILGGAVATFVSLFGAGAWFVYGLRSEAVDVVDSGAEESDGGGLDGEASPPPPPPGCPADMTKIGGGKFFMGSDDRDDDEDERPAHQITLSAYCIDTTEVTVAAYKACSDRGECKRAPKENEWEGIDARARKLYDPLCNVREPEARSSHPVNCVDWELASAFCKAVGKRLPSEAEWEYATRGSDGRKYPWGDEPPTLGTFLNACGKECVAWGKKNRDPDFPLVAMYPVDDGFATTAPAGSFPKGASPFGVQDVVGNVWEWVEDWYGPYGSEPQTDPTGPVSGTERVLRGGAWNGTDPAWVRPSFRFKSTPSLRSHGIGFRCAKSL